MAHTPLTPVFTGLRTGLHLLFVALCGLVIVRAFLAPTPTSIPAIALTVALLATYGCGATLASSTSRSSWLTGVWLAAVSVEWVLLVFLTAEAAYLVFPLFFLYLHVLGRRWGTLALLLATGVAICTLGLHSGWTVGGVVGPLVGAGVALLIGLGYEALAQEARQREDLMRELLATRDRLATTEHESGVLAERARLAREIHDTLAQGLSSIQMLLHAAERTDPERPGIEHIRLARETAADNLGEARRFIRELAPPDLDDHGLAGALRRLADDQWSPQGLDVDVRVSEAVDLPMHVQTALLRIAQGAMSNVVQHADARTATIALTLSPGDLEFVISDDGRGFDAGLDADRPARSDSFGLRATRERVDQLGGTLDVRSLPGTGTTLRVSLALEGRA